jgi:plastocyanin
MRKEIIILMTLFVIFLAIGCTDKGKTIDVKIQNSAFNPDSITISSGNTVKWTNMDSGTHTVVGPDFSSGNISSGKSYEHKFTKTGTYNYYCSIDPSMKGSVIVK